MLPRKIAPVLRSRLASFPAVALVGPQDLARLNRNADLVGADRRFLVCRHSERMENGTQVVCGLAGLVECIDRSS